MIQSAFFTLATLASVFSLVCLVRIVCTWFPDLEYNPVGKFLGRLCDPYLNWFRRFSWTRVGAADFSPILALATLSALTMIFSSISATGRISLLVVILVLFQVVWSFVSFVLNLLILFLFIRLVYDLINRYQYGPFWVMLDRFLNPVVSVVSRGIMNILGRTRPLRYRVSLAATFVTILAVRIGVSVGMRYLELLLRS